MGKQVVAQAGGRAHGSLGGEILGRQGTGQTDDAQQHQQASHFHHITHIPVVDAHVHHAGHHQGHEQLEAGLQHLEQRPQDALFLVIFHVTQQTFHFILRISEDHCILTLCLVL